MQDCKLFCSALLYTELSEYANEPVYASVYDIPLESRPNGSHQANKHLSHLCPIEELLPVLYA